MLCNSVKMRPKQCLNDVSKISDLLDRNTQAFRGKVDRAIFLVALQPRLFGMSLLGLHRGLFRLRQKAIDCVPELWRPYSVPDKELSFILPEFGNVRLAGAFKKAGKLMKNNRVDWWRGPASEFNLRTILEVY